MKDRSVEKTEQELRAAKLQQTFASLKLRRAYERLMAVCDTALLEEPTKVPAKETVAAERDAASEE